MLIDRPYNAWYICLASSKTLAAKTELLKRTDAGEFGKRVRFSVFGLGDFDASPEGVKERLRDVTKNMKFYARME